jgi:hypothetical protein
MGALFQDRLADWTVGRNITLTLILILDSSVPHEESSRWGSQWMQWQLLVQLRANNNRGRSTRTRVRIGTRSTEEKKRSAWEELTCDCKAWFMCNIWSVRLVVSVLIAVARRRLVETGNPSACATVVCKWCKSARALYLSVIETGCNPTVNKSNHPN